MRLALAVALCSPLAAPLWAQDPQLGLMRARMAENLRNLPDYTCVETIERSRRVLPDGPRMTDRVRLEVALVGGREMFAWPGTESFEDTLSRELVTRGAFGYGNFGLYARSMFQGRDARFGPPERLLRNGISVIRWNYHVGREAGGIQIAVGDRTALVGFGGAVYADASTLDVLRLEVTADPLPETFGSSLNQDTVEYARVAMGDETFLLPQSSRLIMTVPGREDINRVSFSGCRRFAGQSTIRFEPLDAAPEAAASAAPMVEVTLPDALKVELELMDEIRLGTVAAGDAVRAQLRSDLRWDGRTQVARGAIAEGRITRAEFYSNGTLLGLTFTSLAWNGGHAALDLTLDSARGVSRVDRRRLPPLTYGVEPSEGLITVRSNRDELERGVRLTWRTRPN